MGGTFFIFSYLILHKCIHIGLLAPHDFNKAAMIAFSSWLMCSPVWYLVGIRYCHLIHLLLEDNWISALFSFLNWLGGRLGSHL